MKSPESAKLLPVQTYWTKHFMFSCPCIYLSLIAVLSQWCSLRYYIVLFYFFWRSLWIASFSLPKLLSNWFCLPQADYRYLVFPSIILSCLAAFGVWIMMWMHCCAKHIWLFQDELFKFYIGSSCSCDSYLMFLIQLLNYRSYMIIWVDIPTIHFKSEQLPPTSTSPFKNWHSESWMDIKLIRQVRCSEQIQKEKEEKDLNHQCNIFLLTPSWS